MDKNLLNRRNNSFLQKADKRLLSELSKGQHPSSLIICCSDSRVIPEKIFDSTFGELFVIRTAGNVINDGELATIEYAIEHLKIRNIVVLGHTHCGAVHAALHHEKGKYLAPILDKICNNIKDAKEEKQASIINAIEVAKSIKDKFPSYDGEVLPALYDIEEGTVSWLD